MWPHGRAIFTPAFIVGGGVLSLTLVAIIFGFLLVESAPIFRHAGLAFLMRTDWDERSDVYGALPFLYGTLMVTCLALTLAIPIALASALFVSEVLRGKLRLLLKALIEMLAGIPSIVYGLLGVALLVPSLERYLPVESGNGILAAAILLTVMILPTIMTLSEDACRSVPSAHRDAGLGLGLSRVQLVARIVLPQAFPGILGAVLLGIGRAMGETMAVMLVVGGLDRLPVPLWDMTASTHTLTSKIGREAAEALGFGLKWHALIGLGAILFTLVIAITLMGQIIRPRRPTYA